MKDKFSVYIISPPNSDEVLTTCNKLIFKKLKKKKKIDIICFYPNYEDIIEPLLKSKFMKKHYILHPQKTYNYNYISMKLFIINFTQHLIYLTNKKEPDYSYIDIIFNNMQVL
jgi:hypothetical protein